MSNSNNIYTPPKYDTAEYHYDKIIFVVESVFKDDAEQVNDILLRLIKQDLENPEKNR